MSNPPINEALNFLIAYAPDRMTALRRSLSEQAQALLIPDMQGVSAPDVRTQARVVLEALEGLQPTAMTLLRGAMQRGQSANHLEALAAYVTIVGSFIGAVVAMQGVPPWLKIVPMVVAGTASAVGLWSNNQRRTLIGGGLTAQIETLSGASLRAGQIAAELKSYLDPADVTDYTDQARPVITAGNSLMREVIMAQVALGVFPEADHASA